MGDPSNTHGWQPNQKLCSREHWNSEPLSALYFTFSSQWSVAVANASTVNALSCRRVGRVIKLKGNFLQKTSRKAQNPHGASLHFLKTYTACTTDCTT